MSTRVRILTRTAVESTTVLMKRAQRSQLAADIYVQLIAASQRLSISSPDLFGELALMAVLAADKFAETVDSEKVDGGS